MRRRSVILVLAAIAALAPSVRSVSAAAGDVWVVNEGSGDIDVIDPATDRIVRTIDVLDPNGDGLPDTPRGLAFATAPDDLAAAAFVAQDALINVLDVATGAQRRAPYDVGSEPGLAGVVLRGLATARPRWLDDPAGFSVLRSYLFAAATLPSGEARLLVIDQVTLLDAPPFVSPLVANVSLDPGATALEVRALRTGSGDFAQRVWVTLSSDATSAPALSAVLVAAGPLRADPWKVRERHDFPLAAGASVPPTLGFGSPPGREAPILPTGPDGRLVNLQDGGQCSGLGQPSAVAVTGPGPGSYTVFALDRGTDTLRVINPLDCTEYTSAPIAVGAGPVALAPLGELRWQAVFVANHDDDTISRVDNDGTTHPPIRLAPAGPSCSKCPIALGIVPLAACGVEDVQFAIEDTVPDGTPDIVISFDKVGCPQPDSAEVVVNCKCTDADPNCFCQCTCNPPVDGCYCPGFVGGFAGTAGLGPGEQLIGNPQDPIGGENPWKELGRTVNSPFVHDDAGLPDQSWIYGLETDLDPP